MPDDPADLFVKPTWPPPYSHRDRVVEIAHAELENGDHTGLRYWVEVLPDYPDGATHPKHWCGAMALACLRWAELCEWTWVVGAGFLYVDDSGRRTREPRLPLVAVPEPGDIAYFHKAQHHAIVVEVVGGDVVTIDGNQSNRSQPPDRHRNPAILKRTRPLREAEGYFSIGGLVS